MKLEIKELTKHYGTVCALDNFSAALEPGIYGILGPNGAGKSTLMNLLTDTLKRETGQIVLDGRDILSMGAAYRSLLGYMPQRQGFYEEFSVGRFLHYMAALKGMSRRQAREQIPRLLETVGLSSQLHKKMGSLSGGMCQRILLVQALLNDPKLLLLDEPTAGLDPEERIRIRNHISAIATDKIVLLATHVVSDIESIAQKILIMKKGRLLVADTPAALIESIKPYVTEIECEAAELPDYQQKYLISNVFQTDGHLRLQLVGRNIPSGNPHNCRITLDDVYLFYMNDQIARGDHGTAP